MRKIARVDQNQAEIVGALREVGASVHVTSQLGGGFPDIVVGWQRRTYLMEIKREKGSPSSQALTDDERKFHEEWRGQASVVRSVAEALKVLGIVRG